VLALMKEAAGRPARVLKHPAPNPLIMAFGHSAIELQLRFWIADAHNGVQNIKGEILLELWRLFREHGIPLPRPKQDIVVHPASQDSESAAEQDLPVSGPRVGKRLGSVS
jgi:small-conductance mechanosensitive channel